MPVYFFHVRHGDQLGVDAAGLELPDTAAVRRRAVELAREIMSDAVLAGELSLDSSIEVTNQAGDLVLVLPFSDAADIRPPQRPGTSA